MASADGNTLAQQEQLQQEHHYPHPPSSDRFPRHLRATTAADEAAAVTDIVPFLRQLSGEVDSGGVYLPNAVAPVTSAGVTAGTTAAARGLGAGMVVGGAATKHTGVDPDDATEGAARPGPDRRERDLDAERQALLTMLLAHACFEHDATPRTFIEQVLRLYETKVLDSIQFLFDMGFVPRVAEAASVRTDAVNRAAIVEAVRRRIEEAGASDPLLLSAWPTEATPVAAVAGTETRRDGGAAIAGSAVNDDSGATTAALGLRVLSTSRYWRDFEEEGLIARGSFGDVYRTRHRLDGKRYAIKKVVFRGIGVSHPHARAVMREVQCLAQLDHKNIVRYHTSWLESGWVEKGVGHYCQHAAPESRGATATAGDGRRDESWPLAAATRARALTVGSNGTAFTKERHPADAAAYAEDALVRVRPHLIPGGAEEPRSGGVMSESNLGLGWVFEKKGDTGSVDCYNEEAKAPGRGRFRGDGNGSWGGGLVNGNRGAGGDLSLASVTPPRKIRSPNGVFLQSEARERGFTHWTAEDVESDTSRWSEVSSGAGVNWESNEAAKLGGPTGGGGAPSRSSNRSRMPPGVRKLRAEMFRHPSIDIDDLVSFGTSSHTGGEATTDHGDETSGGGGGWSDWEAASPNDALGGGVGGRRRSGGGHGRRGRGREGGNWVRPSASRDELVQYPVTLYIQMNLCPGDTLQDWLVKRNAYLTSETETSGSGVLIEDHERLACSGSDSSCFASTVCAAPPPIHPVPMLSSPPLLTKDLDAGIKPRGTPAISPRTDPVTYASSDETSESSSNCSGGDELVLGGAELCQEPPPPLPREVIAGLLGRGGGGPKQGFDTVSDAAACEGTKSPKPVLSPARSLVSDGAVVCEGSGQPGRVDLHEALGMFRQLAEGVAHIHSKGIIHRDIKPENVFVGEDDFLKIGDFGLSRTEAATAVGVVADTEAPSAAAAADKAAHRSDPSASDVADPRNDRVLEEDKEEAAIVPRPPGHGECHTGGVGTASYASPEQLQGRRYGVRSDLFSLGLVLLELCCCFATLHERADVFQSMRLSDGKAPARLKARSPFLGELAEFLCRTDPDLRPTAAEVLERLDALGGRCGCPGCPGSGRSGRGFGGVVASGCLGGGRDTDEPGDVLLREELAEKTRKVVEQEALIDQLQRKLTELSRNSSPRVEPVQPSSSGFVGALNMEALGLGPAAAAGVSDCAENSSTNVRHVAGASAVAAAEPVP